MLMQIPWAQIPGVRHSFTSVNKVQDGALPPLFLALSAALASLDHLKYESMETAFRGKLHSPAPLFHLGRAGSHPP